MCSALQTGRCTLPPKRSWGCREVCKACKAPLFAPCSLPDLRPRSLPAPARPRPQLIELLGGPDQVAELTGRKGSVSMDGENKASYKLRSVEVGGLGPPAALRPPCHAPFPLYPLLC